MAEKTVEEIKRIILAWVEGEGEGSVEDDDWAEENVLLIEEGGWVEDGKYSRAESIYDVDDLYFRIKYLKTNSGYWSDPEYRKPTIEQVEPVEVTHTIYKVKKA